MSRQRSRRVPAVSPLDGLIEAERRAEHVVITNRVHEVLALDDMDFLVIGELAGRRLYPTAAAELARLALALPNARTALNSSVVLHILDRGIHRPTRLHRLAISFGASARCTSGRGYFDPDKLHAEAVAGNVPARCVFAALGEPIAPWRDEGQRIRAALALRELVIAFRDGAAR